MSSPTQNPSTLTYKVMAYRLGASLLVLALLAFALAWTSTRFQDVNSWSTFLSMLLLGAGLLWGGWWVMRSENPPRWLGAVLLLAAVLRLAAGLLWFNALPVLGHGSPPELAGYAMADAHERDLAAWRLAESGKSLWKAYDGFSKADQYGGMLFLSSLLYRYMGGASHQPLMMVVLVACVSALAVLFTWGMARRAWGDRAGMIAAWGMALYPEAVYLGSSQMREAFSIPLAAAAFYGLIRLRQEPSRSGLVWILAPLALALPLSPPFAAMLFGMLLVAGLLMGHSRLTQNIHDRRILWLAILLLAVLVFAGLWLTLSQFGPEGENNPLAIISWWVSKSADYQMHLTQKASGWVQKMFRLTPEWMHMPLLIGYGVARPFLPAALVVDSQSAIWPWIELWRSIGWTILLAFLAYAPLRLLTKRDATRFVQALVFIVWAVILVASFRSGGDQADNPRYRAAFASLQIGLAAWVWVAQERSADVWLRRALASLGFVLAWFLPWYLRREIPEIWPISDVFKTFALGIVSAALFAIWDWARGSPGSQSEKLNG